MSKIADAPAPAQPLPAPFPRSWLPEHLVPVAAELAGCVRDYGPDEVEQILAQVSPEDMGWLIITLAAMVDADRTPRELLAWTREMARSRDKEPAGRAHKPGRSAEERKAANKAWNSKRVPCPECGESTRRGNLNRHRERVHWRPAAAEQVA